MSTLGLVSGSLEREQEQLSSLSSAMLALEADILGHADTLGFSLEEVESSRSLIYNFANRLNQALMTDSASPDLQTLVVSIKIGAKRLDDWQEDLGSLLLHLQNNDALSIGTLSVMNDVLSLLDNEFTQDLRRLYAR